MHQNAALVAIAGTSGAPGRTSLTANLAALAAKNGKRVLAIDLDTAAPALRFCFGLDSAASGLAAAMRLAGQGRLDSEQLMKIVEYHEVRPRNLRLITGLARDSLISEVTPGRVETLFELAKAHFDLVFIDTPPIPTKAVLGQSAGSGCHELLASICAVDAATVLIAEPSLAGVSRLIEAAAVLRDLGARHVITVLNRARPGLHSVREVQQATFDLAGFELDAVIADDRFAFDLAQMEGRPVVLRRRRSDATAGLRQLLALVTASGGG
ncbi:MAG: hypothetical protein RLZZ626_53 [Actinomycetota bacterium]|jgi:MinD-like ATPase involved in chromosome partitioning or flagellar assembly